MWLRIVKTMWQFLEKNIFKKKLIEWSSEWGALFYARVIFYLLFVRRREDEIKKGRDCVKSPINKERLVVYPSITIDTLNILTIFIPSNPTEL